ncbi:MAG: DUF2931 family protein [Hymenobacter sp.]|nr:MAG: DUF2931 family protein [Hymenobacter sp.]
MSKLFFFLLAGGLGLAALAGCHPLEPYQTERFALTADPAAADGYPMEIVEGRFLTSENQAISLSTKFLEGDWGESSTSSVSGDGRAAAPDSLEVRWFSYPEDKFYEGHFLLPQRRIYDLLKQGYWNTDDQRHETYSALTTCLLPTGVVVVWLSGQNQVLLGRYQGQEIKFDFKHFNEAANRPRMIAQEQAKLPATVQAEIRTHSLSTRKWDTYLKTYPWKIEFSQPLDLYYYGVDYFNGEALSYPPGKDTINYAKAFLGTGVRPVPHNLLLKVNAGYGRKREVFIKAFDEAETFQAFQALHAANPTLPLTLYIETDERVSKARLILKNERQQVELTKAQVGLYNGN